MFNFLSEKINFVKHLGFCVKESNYLLEIYLNLQHKIFQSNDTSNGYQILCKLNEYSVTVWKQMEQKL